MTVRWTDLALRDLTTIRTHIAGEDAAAADRIVQRINQVTRSLCEPVAYSGRQGKVRGTWELVVPRVPYIVVYQRNEEATTILRVLHSAQQWPSS